MSRVASDATSGQRRRLDFVVAVRRADVGGFFFGAFFFWPALPSVDGFGVATPVEPKPPAPRAVLRAVVASVEFGAHDGANHHLRDALAALHDERLVAEIDQDDLLLRRDSRSRSCRVR